MKKLDLSCLIPVSSSKSGIHCRNVDGTQENVEGKRTCNKPEKFKNFRP
jgi:hypothetical protein